MIKDIVFEEGKISVAGRRSISITVSEFVAIQNEIEKKYGDKWKEAIYKGVKKGAGKVWLHYLGKKYLDIADHPGIFKIIKSALEIFNQTGFGEPEVSSIDTKKFSATFILKNSSIAEEYSSKGEVVCYFTAAMLAALMKMIFGINMDCKEVRCKAKGDSYCEFITESSKK